MRHGANIFSLFTHAISVHIENAQGHSANSAVSGEMPVVQTTGLHGLEHNVPGCNNLVIIIAIARY